MADGTKIRTGSFQTVGQSPAVRAPGSKARQRRSKTRKRTSRGRTPSGPFLFLLLVVALVVGVVIFRPDADPDHERNYRIRECVTNLELLAEQQATFHAKHGRYLACPRFPSKVSGDEPFVWRYKCKPGLQKTLRDGTLRYLDCKQGEVCDRAYHVCISPDDKSVRPAYVETAPACWEQLMGFLGDLPLRGQYEVEAPPSIHPHDPAHADLSCNCTWEATCRADLDGDGLPEVFRATDKKTTWTTAAIDYGKAG